MHRVSPKGRLTRAEGILDAPRSTLECVTGALCADCRAVVWKLSIDLISLDCTSSPAAIVTDRMQRMHTDGHVSRCTAFHLTPTT